MHAAQPTAGRQRRRSRLDAGFLRVKAFLTAAFLRVKGRLADIGLRARDFAGPRKETRSGRQGDAMAI
ncbi:MAG: hypothetical protein ACE10M_07495 [Alphaproteobacteria bacterium]